MFNALKYTEEMEKVGFTREQAEVSMKLLVETMNENFATKADLKELAWQLQTEIRAVETRLESKIQALDFRVQSLESTIKGLEYKLIVKLGSMMGAMLTLSIAITAFLIKIVPTIGQ